MNTPGPLWRIVLMAEKYGRQTLKLEEVAEEIGIAPSTIINRRAGNDQGYTLLSVPPRGLVRLQQIVAADIAGFMEDRDPACVEAAQAVLRRYGLTM